MPHALLHADLEQRARLTGVVTVVLERIAHRFGYDRVGGKMHDGVDFILAHGAFDQLTVADLTDDQRCIAYRLTKAGVEVVERHDAFATCLQLQ